MALSGIELIEASSSTLTLGMDNEAGHITLQAALNDAFTEGLMILYSATAPANYQAEFGPFDQATLYYLRARQGTGAWCGTVAISTNGYTTFSAAPGDSAEIILTIAAICNETITVETADNSGFLNAEEVYTGTPTSPIPVTCTETGLSQYFRGKVDDETDWIAFADAVAANSVSNIEVTNVGICQLTVAWNTSNNQSIVQISTDGQFWTTVFNESVGGGAGSKVITDLQPATHYFIRIADEAAEPYFWALPVQSDTADVGYSGNAAWTSVALELTSNVAGLAYRIDRWDYENEEWFAEPIADGTTTGLTQHFSVTGLAMGQTIKTRAVIVEGAVDVWTNELEHTTHGIFGLTATAASHTAIDLTWTNESHDPVYGVRLFRATNAQFTGEVEIHRWTTTDPELYADTGLTQGTAYHYRIYVADGVTCTPATASTPGISNLAAVATGRTTATVTFNTTETVATIEVNGTVVQNLSNLAPGPQSVPLTGLTAGTAYSIRVKDTGDWASTDCHTWGVYDVDLTAVDHDTLRLTFSTTKPDATCTVEYSPNENFWPVYQAFQGLVVGTRIQPINGLTPRTEYWVRVTDDDVNWMTLSKATYPAPILMGPCFVTIDFGTISVSDEVPQARFLQITCDEMLVCGTAADWFLDGVAVVEAAAACLPGESVQGRGTLRWDQSAGTLSWQAPGDTEPGTAWKAGAGFDRILVLPSANQEKWLAVRVYEGYLPENSEASQVAVSEQWAGSWGLADVTAAQAAAGLVDEYEWMLSNVAGAAIENLRVWLVDDNPTFLELSADGETYCRPTAQSPLALGDLAAEDATLLFLRRSIPAQTAGAPAVRHLVRFAANVPNLTAGIELETRVFYRIFAPETVHLFAETAPIEFNASPIAVVSTLPATPAQTFEDGIYYLAAAVHNGIALGSLSDTVILSILDGVVWLRPPKKPHSATLTLDDGLPKVSAAYAEEYPYRAHEWALAITTDGSTPPANTPDFTQSIGLSGTSVLISYLPPAENNSVVKVRVQVRRNDGTDESPVWTYSTEEIILALTISLAVPTPAIGGRALAHGQEA